MQQIQEETVYDVGGIKFTTINGVVEFSESAIYQWVSAIESKNIITASQRLQIVEALIADRSKMIQMLQLVDEAHYLKNS